MHLHACHMIFTHFARDAVRRRIDDRCRHDRKARHLMCANASADPLNRSLNRHAKLQRCAPAPSARRSTPGSEPHEQTRLDMRLAKAQSATAAKCVAPFVDDIAIAAMSHSPRESLQAERRPESRLLRECMDTSFIHGHAWPRPIPPHAIHPPRDPAGSCRIWPCRRCPC